jgi:hypothetical protein
MTRYNFGAIAQVIDLDSREDVIAVTRDLSFSGCFIKTNSPFPRGRVVIVRITCLGADFAATGTVTGNITWEGMGIEFTKIGPKDQAVIEQWLDPHPHYRQEHSVRGVPVTTFRQLQTNRLSDDTERHEATSSGTLLALEAPSMPGQTVRLKNRLAHESRNHRVLPAEPEAKAHKPGCVPWSSYNRREISGSSTPNPSTRPPKIQGRKRIPDVAHNRMLP